MSLAQIGLGEGGARGSKQSEVAATTTTWGLRRRRKRSWALQRRRGVGSRKKRRFGSSLLPESGAVGDPEPVSPSKLSKFFFRKTNQRKREDSGENVFSNCFLPCSICSLYLCPGMSSYSEQKKLCHHKRFSEDLGLFHLLIFKWIIHPQIFTPCFSSFPYLPLSMSPCLSILKAILLGKASLTQIAEYHLKQL